MKALLYKDACVIWGQLKILVLLVALFCLMPQLRLNGFFLIYAGIMFPTTLMSFDERSKWDTLAGMLPYADRERVLSRYVSGWAALACGAVLYHSGAWAWFGGGDRPGLAGGPGAGDPGGFFPDPVSGGGGEGADLYLADLCSGGNPDGCAE